MLPEAPRKLPRKPPDSSEKVSESYQKFPEDPAVPRSPWKLLQVQLYKPESYQKSPDLFLFVMRLSADNSVMRTLVAGNARC